MTGFNVKNIIFDFDGVILDSMPIRSDGFRKIFTKYEHSLVEELITYHNLNGGLSRFIKIRYFYKELLNKDIIEDKVNEYASEYSDYMRKHLLSPELIINETLDFIKENHKDINMTVASGSEQKELRHINKSLELDKYFKLILGSPTPKNENVRDTIEELSFKKDETILIGDSINDYDAAKINGIRFFGYNNISLKECSDFYIDSFKDFNLK
jgi:phosphoglycolate phosphatase-like HAD superfamily hydrolase